MSNTAIQYLTHEEFGAFLNEESREKVIIISLEHCKPCDAITEDFEALQDKKEITDIALYKMVFPLKDFPKEIAQEIGVRHYPTVFYFIDEECAGRIMGRVPSANKSSETGLMNWITQTRKRIENKKPTIEA